MLTSRSYSDSDISQHHLDQFLFCEKVSGFIEESIHVGVGEFKIGRELITDSLRPCQGVIAKLKNGEYAIYHAFTKLQNATFQNFVSAINEKGVEFVIVFQKAEPAINKEKAPFLAISLAENLNCKVKRVHIEHTGIYVNADTNQVVLFNQPQYVGGSETKIILDEPQELNIEQISIKESVDTILRENKGGVSLPNGDIRFPDNFKIQGRFLSKSVSIPHTESDDTNSNSKSTSTLTSSDEKKVITSSDKEKKLKGKGTFKHTISHKSLFSRKNSNPERKSNNKSLLESDSEKNNKNKNLLNSDSEKNKKNKGLKIFTINSKNTKKEKPDDEITVINLERYSKK